MPWASQGFWVTAVVTGDPQDYEDNSDSGEIWVPGSPLFPIALLDPLEGSGELGNRMEFLDALRGRCCSRRAIGCYLVNVLISLMAIAIAAIAKGIDAAKGRLLDVP